MKTCNKFVETINGKRLKYTLPDYTDKFIIAHDLDGKITPLLVSNKRNVIIEDIENLKKDNIVIIPFNSNDIFTIDLKNLTKYEGI